MRAKPRSSNTRSPSPTSRPSSVATTAATTVVDLTGNLWLDLGSLKHYIDEDKEKFDGGGVYFREGGSTATSPEVLTGPPST